MVQSKHKKPNKNQRENTIKKHGRQSDITQFRSQLDALGLKIIQVTADGNCFFRALADQLEGDEEKHDKYRSMVVQYIRNHQEEFAPFIEDEVPFDEYCKSMEDDGTWAGNMELQAASLATRSNVCIHRFMSPRWYIKNFDSHGTRMVHLSYHDNEHYNSVRLKEDCGSGPAKHVILKVDSDISLASSQAKAVYNLSNVRSRGYATDMTSVKMVMNGTGCKNYAKAEQVLKEVSGSVDAAIEFLIAEQAMDEDPDDSSKLHCGSSISHECESQSGTNVACETDIAEDNPEPTRDPSSQQNDRKIQKETRHARGSKKKQKIRPAIGKSSSISTIKDKPNGNRSLKDKRNRRKESGSPSPVCKAADIPDMGALCI